MSEEPKPVTEKDTEIIAHWFKMAKEAKTTEDLTDLINTLGQDYQHDYGTIIKAMAAVMVGAMTVFDRGPQGGITGFQAGALGWEMIREFMSIDGPAKIVDYEKFLFPQYEREFQKAMPQATFDWLKEEAVKRLEKDSDAVSRVTDHWKAIASGVIPFGYYIKEEG